MVETSQPSTAPYDAFTKPKAVREKSGRRKRQVGRRLPCVICPVCMEMRAETRLRSQRRGSAREAADARMEGWCRGIREWWVMRKERREPWRGYSRVGMEESCRLGELEEDKSET